jgi:hypothetical protein
MVFGLDRLIKSKPSPPSDFELSLGGGLAQIAAGKQSSEEEQRRYLLENDMILTDRNLASLLQGMSHTVWTDTKGLIGEPNKVYEMDNPRFVALGIAATSLKRTSYVSDKDARIQVWEDESLCLKVKMTMSEEENVRGGALVVDALKGVIIWNDLGAINGRVSKLVKSRPNSYQVEVGPIGKEDRR